MPAAHKSSNETKFSFKNQNLKVKKEKEEREEVNCVPNDSPCCSLAPDALALYQSCFLRMDVSCFDSQHLPQPE